VGKPARRLTTALARLQGVLGDLNDAVVAEAWLRPLAQGASPGEALVAGELTGRQWVAIEEGRRSWRSAWQEAATPSLRSWLR
jgi:CHAD domain-containing protein